MNKVQGIANSIRNTDLSTAMDKWAIMAYWVDTLDDASADLEALIREASIVNATAQDQGLAAALAKFK